MTVINFIDIYSPTITLGEIIEKQKVKNYSQEIEYYYNKKLILFLITFYDKKLPIEVTLLENNYDKMLNNKLEEIFEENLDMDLINSLCTDICFYTNLNFVKKIYEKYTYIFSCDCDYTYYTESTNYINYNLAKSACSGEQYDIALYLMEQHNFTILNLEYLYLYNIKPKTLKKILELEKLENYKHNSSILENFCFLVRYKNYEIQKILVEEILKLDILGKYDYLSKILIHLNENSSSETIRFILYHSLFDGNFIHIEEWYNIISRVYHYDVKLKNPNPHLKTEIFETYFEYLMNKNIDISRILIYEDYFIIQVLVRLPNSVNLLSKIFDIVIDYGIVNEIYISLFKYGNIETYKFIENKENDFNIKDRYDFEQMLSYVLYNKDNRVITQFLKKFREKFDYQNTEVNFEFLELNNRYQNKIKKLKILSKFIDLKNQKRKLFGYFHNKKDIHLNLIKYIIKKVSDNNILDETEDIISRLFEAICIRKCYDTYQYLIKLLVGKDNLWFLLGYSIKYYGWFSNQNNLLLELCENGSVSLKSIENKYKEHILFEFLNYDEEKKFNKFNYYNILQNFKHNDFNMKLTNYGWGWEEFYPLLEGPIKNNNYYLILDCLKMGFKFTDLYKKYYKSYRYLVSSHNEIKKWISLYNVIRRCTIRKHLKYKGKHKYKFKESIVNFETKPERKENSIVHRGGPYFYNNMDELDSMCDFREHNYIFPKHITPAELVSLTKNEIYMCQKTDGLLVKDIKKHIMFPPISADFENISWDAEYIKELDLYLVFGMRSYSKKNNTPYEDYLDLMFEHKICYNFKKNDDYLELNKLKAEALEILEFCEKYKHIAMKWYPKKVWRFRDTKEILDLLSQVEKYQECVCRNNWGGSMTDFITNKELKTDGIILMKDKKTLYKYKPERCMTADLKTDRNNIYRCYWDKEEKSWVPVDLRKDKKKPNPEELVKKLEYYHHNPWNIQDIIEHLKKVNINTLYYQKNQKHPKFNSLCKTNKKILNDILRKEYANSRYNFLDIGCGFCNHILWKDPNIKIDGIDIDISVIVENKNIYIRDIADPDKKIETKISKYYWNNFQKLNKKYDVIVMNFSFHYVFNETFGFKNFIYKILNPCSKKGTKLFISLIDIQKEENIDLPNNSYMNVIDSPIDYLGESIKEVVPKWRKTYYTFRHNTPIKEPMVDVDKLIVLMENYNWKLNQEFKIHNPYDWTNLTRRIEFIKIY